MGAAKEIIEDEAITGAFRTKGVTLKNWPDNPDPNLPRFLAQVVKELNISLPADPRSYVEMCRQQACHGRKVLGIVLEKEEIKTGETFKESKKEHIDKIAELAYQWAVSTSQ